MTTQDEVLKLAEAAGFVQAQDQDDQYEYQRYCMYCVDPVDFERFVARKLAAKHDDANEGDDLMGSSS